MQSKIAIIAPASRCSADDLAIARNHLIAKGYSFYIYPSCETNLTAQQRAQELLTVLTDPEITLIWTLRGGSSCPECLPFLQQHQSQIKAANKKPIIGFSDITALLIYFTQQFSWPCIHGPGVLQYANPNFNPQAAQSMDRFIQTGALPQLHVTQLNAAAAATTSLQATLTGGNATLVALSIGDCNAINTANNIIVLEEVGEAPYAIRRNLQYMQRIGLFDQAKAIVFGNFYQHLNKTIDLEQQQYVAKVLQEFATATKLPIFSCPQIGHGKENLPFAYGCNYQLDPSKQYLFTDEFKL